MWKKQLEATVIKSSPIPITMATRNKKITFSQQILLSMPFLISILESLCNNMLTFLSFIL